MRIELHLRIWNECMESRVVEVQDHKVERKTQERAEICCQVTYNSLLVFTALHQSPFPKDPWHKNTSLCQAWDIRS